ncbi:DNA-binding NarL/FixJ family response regulator [Desulfohalotomaculum tongense]|uniref:response regulator transcription factor n=1 Tax=Desulforadius tongensis TaxID=1216062 RepID=UPI0019597806|nr:response regulator transcription factor [Desulforadius tongensis]MBM7854871.1 DNA-binding NarL/FixJ family response regulator [Desulforadius tongensis]
MEKIKVMLIEDHNVFREGLKKLIDLEENMAVVAEANTYQQALQNINDNVDVTLLDINLPDGDGLDLCTKFKKQYPHIKHVALTTYDDAIFIKKAMECGVDGFVPKHAFFDEIKAAILMTYKGRSYLYPGLSTDTIIHLSEPGLTESELNILQLLASGKNQKEIAGQLYISLSTFRRRVKSIFKKLKVGTIEEALTVAIKKGLIH